MASVTIGDFVLNEDTVQEFTEEELVALLEQWFLERFEDPANSQYYDGDEGDYAWSDGPYDALDELDAVFGDLVPQQTVLDAAVRLEDRALQWAKRDRVGVVHAGEFHLQGESNFEANGMVVKPPLRASGPFVAGQGPAIGRGYVGSPRSPGIRGTRGGSQGGAFQYDSFQPSPVSSPRQGELGTEEEQRRELVASLDAFDREIAAMLALPPRNHNQPPELVADDFFDLTDLRALREQTVAPSPDAGLVYALAVRIRAIAVAMGEHARENKLPYILSGIAYVAVNSPQQVEDHLNNIAANAEKWAQLLGLM